MEGLQKFLQLLNDNWTSILVCIGLVIGIVKKTQDYMSKSQDEKIEIAKKQIQTTILKMISDAEVDWQEWSKAGSIKRAQVIKQIYEEYPILSKVVDQKALIEWIDEQIDSALDTLREIVKTNATSTSKDGN
ncbi:hypothetical protein GT674_04245 [Blautia sp. BIOML-A1]|jgi:tRNA U34 5-carboxymethylaminomethyl modifying enzyme MnmG/GidA|uniref:hypothetical protein n=1 Tax=Blautia sp. BIOML-A1 TaxID=2584624 RepID=UPI0013693E5F|nr:hypothetical protein [Blautia sp. BIOML-A1]MZT65215.1 hypothetical protein [Blautia sp. BIOML-A1]